MIPRADHFNIADIRAAADIIEEATDNVTYLGFCDANTPATSSPKWSILKIEQSGIVKPILTTFKWATGLCSYNLVWDNRADYEYTFKKF